MEGLDGWKKKLSAFRKRADKVETHKQFESFDRALYKAYENMRATGLNYRDLDGLSRRDEEIKELRQRALVNIDKAERRDQEAREEKLRKMKADAPREGGFEREIRVMQAHRQVHQIGKWVV